MRITTPPNTHHSYWERQVKLHFLIHDMVSTEPVAAQDWNVEMGQTRSMRIELNSTVEIERGVGEMTFS